MNPLDPAITAEPADTTLIRPRYRVAYLVSHPIQYHTPMLRLIAAQPDIDLTVFFQSDLSVRGYQDVGFGVEVKWDIPLLDGYHYEFLPAIGRRDSVANGRPFSYGLATRLRRGKYDCLWVHGYARWFNVVAILAARLASIPVFVRDDATAISNYRPPIKAWLKRWYFYLLGTLCQGFLATGTMNRDYYLQNGIDPSQIFWVPNCVDNEYFATLAKKSAPRREEFRRELGLDPGRPVILFAGKFHRKKRAGDLLMAYEALIGRLGKAERPYLLFVGDGDERSEIEAQARHLGDDVRFLGFRNQSELPAFFDLCDVFVLPSNFETWGLVINEVMSVGRPVIVSDHVGCAPDLVKDGVNGYVYPCGSFDALADALYNALSDRERLKAMGRASAEIIAKWNYRRDLEGLRSALAIIHTRQGRKRRDASLA